MLLPRPQYPHPLPDQTNPHPLISLKLTNTNIHQKNSTGDVVQW